MLSPSLWGLPHSSSATAKPKQLTQQCFPHLYGGCPWASQRTTPAVIAAMLSPSLWGLPGQHIPCEVGRVRVQQCFPHLYGGCPNPHIVVKVRYICAAMLSPSLWGLPA